MKCVEQGCDKATGHSGDCAHLVPLWLFGHVDHATDEMKTLLDTGGEVYLRLSPEALRDWYGLMCALKLLSHRGLTDDEKQYALQLKKLATKEPA